ncbi:hypothetical protein ABK040_016069 [Willaertia magna]
MIASVSEDEDSTFRKRSQSSATTQNSSRRLRTLTEPTAEVNTIVPQNNNNEDEDDSGSNLIDPFQNPNYQKSPTTPREDNNNNNELLLITPPTKSTTVPRTTVDVSNFQLNLDSAVKINETQNELSSLSPQSQKTNVPLTSRIRLPTFFRNKFKKTVMNEGEVFDKEELKKLVGEFSNISEYSKKNSEITLQDFTKCLGRLKEHSQQLDNNNTNSNNNSNNSNTNNNDSNFLAKMIFQAVDSDNNGKLDFKEFLSVMSVLVKGTTEEKLDFAFTMIDRDKDGKISREEWITVITTLYKVIESLGLSSSYLYNKLHSPIDYANELFNEMDTENLNYLTLQSYKDAAMRLTDKFVGLGIVNETQPIIQENDNNNNNNNTTNNNGYFQLLPEENFSPTPKNKPLGKLITFGSKRWQLVLNIMLGIRLSIDATGTIERNVRAEDFHVRILFDLLKESNNNLNDWLYLSNTSNNITYIPPPLKNSEEEDNAIDVTFVDYAPFVFKHIRHLSGVSEKSYMMSLGPEQILGNLLLGNLSTLSERITDGKSGSLFFYSSDQRFLVKTITKYEVTCLKRILPYYYHHLKTNPDSLITRILGFYEMTVNKESDKVFFIVMANIFPNTKVLSELYDLKGSTHNRTNPDGFCKKDLDLIEKQRKFKIGAVNHLYYLSILEKDIEFLSKCNVLDYSLLVGVHKVKTGTIILNSVGASATSSVFTMSNAAMEKSTVTSDMITNDNNNNNILNNTSSSVVSGSVTSTGFLSEIETTVSISLNEGDENILLSTPPTTATTILNNSINNNNTNNNNSNSSSSTISNNSSWERKRSGSVSTLKYSRFTRNNKCVCAIPSSILDEMTDEPQEIYYIGIIDILTEFNFKKEAEYNLNIMTGKGESSSAIPPKPYSNRFLKFMYKCFE